MYCDVIVAGVTIGFENETILANERNGSAVICIRVIQGILGENVTLSIQSSELTGNIYIT